MVKQARAGAVPVLALEGGDALFKESPVPAVMLAQSAAKAEVMAQAYGQSLDAWVPGELDVADSTENFLSRVRAHKLPVVAANLVDSSSAPVFPATVVRRLGALTAVVVGVVEPSLWPAGSSLKATDPVAALSSALSKAPPHDAVILLAHATPEQAQGWARAVPGISLILAGHGGQLFFQPRSTPLPSDGGVLQALTLGGGKGGKYLSRLKVTHRAGTRSYLGGEERARHTYEVETATKQLQALPTHVDALARKSSALAALREMEQGSFADFELQALETVVPEDPEVARLVKDYLERNAAREKTLSAGVTVTGAPPPGSPYTGAMLCMGCHVESFQLWARSDHARALDSLQKTNQATDRECIGCHTTGWEKVGGFAEPAAVAPFTHVQCEACHETGRRHVDSAGEKGKISRGAGEAVCKSCHTLQNAPQFDFIKDRERIRHWKGP